MENMEGSKFPFDTTTSRDHLHYDNPPNKLQVVTVSQNDQHIATLMTNPSTPIVNGLLYNYNAHTALGNHDITLNPKLIPTELNWNEMSQQENNHNQNESGVFPSSTEEKNSWFTESFGVQLSKLYAVLLVMFGLIVYIGDSFRTNSFDLAEAFNIYIMLVQLIFLVYIQIDV
ncbi:unnamed protein product, partial [Meganyctiphanes norvegica]